MSILVDLTMPLWSGMPAYPGEPTVSFSPFTTVERDGVAMASVALFSQSGTHVDAPAHFVADGRPVDELDLRRGIGPAKVVDLGTLSPGHIVSVPELVSHAAALSDTERLLLRTGWSARVGTDQYFRDWPVLSMDAVTYLAQLPRLLWLGLDTPSPGTEKTNAAIHQALFATEITLVECLVNLDGLPADVELTCLPLPLQGLDGSPVRAVAHVRAPTERG